MDSMRSMVRGNGAGDNYVLLAGENEHFYELDLTSGYVYKKDEVYDRNKKSLPIVF